MNLPNQIAEPPELATSHYWESRATTAEEKVKDWSVRTCQAEDRIRELEAQLAQVRDTLDISRIDRDAWLERIAKAREILEELHELGSGCRHTKAALDALEGK